MSLKSRDMISIVFAALFAAVPTSAALGQSGVVSGRVVKIYADPSDVVVVTDKVGPCGSALYHFRRSNENFKEIVSLMYLAAASKNVVEIVVSGCANERNMASHGSVAF